MKILTAGDSFTHGEELSDRHQAWPFVLANKMSATVVNLGAPAASNDRISRAVVEHTLTERPDLAIIGWTSPGRQEFADEHGIYDVWPGYSGNLFIRDGMYWRKELVEYVSRYHSVEYYHRRYLQQVMLMQRYLSALGIDYVMMNVVENEPYRRTRFDLYDSYMAQIDRARFIDFGGSGMLEWTYGCPIGPGGHFLEEGHRVVAEKVYEYLRNRSGVS